MALTRSEQMARIRGTDTFPELRLRRALWRAGLRFRLRRPVSQVRPDLVFVSARVAVFIDGCFWHGCPTHYVRPRSSGTFWARKLAENVRRDQRQTRVIEQMGWRVCRVWEHQVFEDQEAVVRLVSRLVADPMARQSGYLWRAVQVDPSGEGDMEKRWLESLRAPRKRKSERRLRSTKKWRSPR